MTETTLTLCKQPVLGLMMWLASMCVTNQGLDEAYVDLSSPGVVLHRQIDIPMDERYSLFLAFRPASGKEAGTQPVPFGSHVCNSLRVEEGQFKPSLALEVEIATTEGKPVRKERLAPRCSDGDTRSNTLEFGQFEMKRGKYNFTLNNLHPVAPGGNGKVQAIFRGQGAGFP